MNDSVRFYIQGGGLWFTDEGVWFEIKESIESRSQESRATWDPMDRFEPPEPEKYKRVILKQEFIGANLVEPEGRERLDWNSNFFYGNDSTKWQTNVPNYSEIFYRNLYDGIDLRYYLNERGLKYDLILGPGTDLNQIKIRYKGAEELRIDHLGNLIIKTNIEDIVDSGLLIYQKYNDSIFELKGKFIRYGDQDYGFELEEDFNRNEVLIIDPRLTYSTFIGGNNRDLGFDIKVDDLGNVYVMGSTYSSDFPTTPGAFNRTFAGIWDVFGFKFDESCQNLLYSTYIGGDKEDQGLCMALDSTGNVYITGMTQSSNFPTTAGAFDTSYNSTDGWGDVFALKLNHNGTKLNYSTFLGGKGYDDGRDIEVDSYNRAYVVGWTNSTDFPTTPGAYDTQYNETDIFIVRLNESGSGLSYSTYVGGNNDDKAASIAVDEFCNAYVTGYTTSLDFPTTLGAYNTTFSGGFYDSFIIKLSSNGSTLNYSTYIGGDNVDYGDSIIVDHSGDVYVTGFTYSTDFPTTPEAFDKELNGTGDCFALKLNIKGSSLDFSTYLGGNDTDGGSDIAVDSEGRVYLSGRTYSLDFPVSSDAYDGSYNGSGDGFFTLFDSNCGTIKYSTYFGGNSYDMTNNHDYDMRGSIYVVGYTNSDDFPVTPNAYNTSISGSEDVFLVKFMFETFFELNSLSLLINSTPTNLTYSRFDQYTFRTKIIDTFSLADLKSVCLTLDPFGTNIKLLWDSTTGLFTKLFDMNNYITLESSSKAYNNSFSRWTIDFNVTFNWTYPDENFHDVQVYAINDSLKISWFNATNFYRVENDLFFNGTLLVKNENNKNITSGDLIQAGELLNWTGLYPVYENTTDIVPPDDEYDISLWDEDENVLFDSPGSGQPFNLTTITPNTTDSDGYNYTINLTGIPLECDKTNCTFTIRIDGDNVTFSDFRPESDKWQTTSNVEVGVTVTDLGGAQVNGSSVIHSVSMDDGSTWGDWELVPDLENASSIIVQDLVTIDDGTDNYIKWRAKDTVGNGPAESAPHRILVDTEDAIFSDPLPLATAESPYEEVEVGITISDNTSGVNASTIKYSISYDAGNNWNEWLAVLGIETGKAVNIKLDLTFPNGTNNRIRWYAFDIAGNGPAISEEYIIKINKPSLPHPLPPEVMLISPPNNTIIQTTSVELSWRLITTTLPDVLFDVVFDTNYPPAALQAPNLTQETYAINDLEDGETYYWKVVPKAGNITGLESETWRFTVDVINYTPQFGLELRLEPMEIELFPGETKYVKARVTNLGELDDNIGIKVNGTIPAVLNLTFNYTTITGVGPDNTVEFNITVTAAMDAQKCELQIIIIASSGKAAEYQILVEDNATLTIKILELDKPGAEKSSSSNLWWIILAITILIIILIVIGIILRRKKKVEDEKIPPSEAVTVTPEEEELEE